MANKSAVIVDDDQFALSAISALVELMGYEVKSFQRPLEALHYLTDHSFDLVLTDYEMPEMDGLELAQEVRKINGKAAIIMIAGAEDAALLGKKALMSGVSDIFSSSIDYTRLTFRMSALEA